MSIRPHAQRPGIVYNAGASLVATAGEALTKFQIVRISDSNLGTVIATGATSSVGEEGQLFVTLHPAPSGSKVELSPGPVLVTGADLTGFSEVVYIGAAGEIVATPAANERTIGSVVNSSTGDWLFGGSFSPPGAASGATPSGTIIVAKSDGDYTTITEGLAAASSGDVVEVYPGDYAENISIPDGVRLMGSHIDLTTRITGADTTGTRVTFEGNGTLRNITVVGPSSGAATAVDCTGLGAAELAVLNTVVVVGGGGTGDLIEGAGSGLVALLDVFHNGGTAGRFVNADTGTWVVDSLTANAGSVTDVFRVGNATVEGHTFLVGPLYTSATNGILMATAGGAFQMDGVIISESGGSAVTNALHFAADGVSVSVTGAHMHGATYDVLVDGGLVGTGTVWTFGGELTEERFSAPAAWPSGAEVLVVATDTGVQNDAALRVGGEFAVGAYFLPSESAFGEGDSTITNMHVFSHDGAATWVDNTADAKSRSGSAFALLQGVTAGNAAYFGSADRTFPGLKYSVTIAQVTGAGAAVWEFWNGSAWTAFDPMVVKSSKPRTSYANVAFGNVQDDQVHWHDDDLTGWALSTQNNQSAYWVRYRITTGITTAPTLERTKLGTDRIELNTDGAVELYGDAAPFRTFWKGTGEDLSTPNGGANGPGLLDTTISSNISYRQEKSKYANGNDERAGTMIECPEGLNTSRPITVSIAWFVEDANLGEVDWSMFLSEVRAGDVIGALDETEVAAAVTPTAQAGIIVTTFEFLVPTLTPGDFMAFMLWRYGSTDASTSDVGLMTIECSGYFWK